MCRPSSYHDRAEMEKLTVEDILSQSEYESQREEVRRRLIALKHFRRIQIGPVISMVFENRDTVRFQIQEMLRAEHIVEPKAIQKEIDSYNELIPENGELSATLFIEIVDNEHIRESIDNFQGLDEFEHVFIEFGDDRIAAIFEAGHSRSDRISAVQYVRFKIGKEQLKVLNTVSEPVCIVIDHVGYYHRTPLSRETRGFLVQDLAQTNGPTE